MVFSQSRKMMSAHKGWRQTEVVLMTFLVTGGNMRALSLGAEYWHRDAVSCRQSSLGFNAFRVRTLLSQATLWYLLAFTISHSTTEMHS